MNTLRKILWPLLAGLTSAVLLAGCGSSASTDASQNTVSTPSAPTKTMAAENKVTAQAKKPALAPTASAQTTGWESYQSSKGGYSVQMPGKVTTSSNPVKTEMGNINAETAATSDKESAFLVIFSDYPEAMKKANPKKVLDGARSGAINKMKGKIQSEKSISINGFPGREFSASTDVGGRKSFVKARIYLVNTRLYQQIVVVPAAAKPVEKINKFLDSFKIQAKK